MAATPRFLISAILRNVQTSQPLRLLPKAGAPRLGVRCSSYLSSPQVRDLNEYPEVEVVHDPPEWRFVERLLPPTTVPKLVPKPEYPSGWKPPASVDVEKQKFFVARNKNHMVPVYLQTRFRGQRRITVVKNVHGDIWALERALREVVERARNGKLCASRVNELSGQIHLHGDYVDVVREFLKERGF